MKRRFLALSAFLGSAIASLAENNVTAVTPAGLEDAISDLQGYVAGTMGPVRTFVVYVLGALFGIVAILLVWKYGRRLINRG